MKNIYILVLMLISISLYSCSKSGKLNDYGFSGSVISKTDTTYNVIFKFGNPQKGEIENVVETFFDENGRDTLACNYDKNGKLISFIETKRKNNGDVSQQIEYIIQDFPNMKSKYKSIETENYSYQKKEGKTVGIVIRSKVEEENPDSTKNSDLEPDTYIYEKTQKIEFRYGKIPTNFKVKTEDYSVSFMDDHDRIVKSFDNYGVWEAGYDEKGLLVSSAYSSYDNTQASKYFYEYEFDCNGNVNKRTIYKTEGNKKNAVQYITTSYKYNTK